jgi:hypothetical protein
MHWKRSSTAATQALDRDTYRLPLAFLPRRLLEEFSVLCSSSPLFFVLRSWSVRGPSFLVRPGSFVLGPSGVLGPWFWSFGRVPWRTMDYVQGTDDSVGDSKLSVDGLSGQYLTRPDLNRDDNAAPEVGASERSVSVQNVSPITKRPSSIMVVQLFSIVASWAHKRWVGWMHACCVSRPEAGLPLSLGLVENERRLFRGWAGGFGNCGTGLMPESN